MSSNITLLAIDLAKNVFQLHGVDHAGKPILRKRLSRSKIAHSTPKCNFVSQLLKISL